MGKSVIAVSTASVAETSTEPDIIKKVESLEVLDTEANIGTWVDGEVQCDDRWIEGTDEDADEDTL